MSLGPMRVPRFPKQIITTNAASADSGVVFFEGAGFEHYAFQLTGTFTNYTVTIYGTLDPAAVVTQGQIAANAAYPAPGAAGGAWFPIPAPSEQSGTGPVVNPLTAINQVLETKVPLVAVWVHVAGASQTGSVTVVGWAID